MVTLVTGRKQTQVLGHSYKFSGETGKMKIAQKASDSILTIATYSLSGRSQRCQDIDKDHILDAFIQSFSNT